MSITRKNAVAVALISLTIWCGLGFPSSFEEMIFYLKFKSFSLSERHQSSLEDLMPFGWEIVCDSPGYSGDFYLERYKKKFPAAGAMNDGAWGLTFIRPDGNYIQASGSCGRRIFITIRRGGCVSRNGAVVERVVEATQFNCSHFEIFQIGSN